MSAMDGVTILNTYDRAAGYGILVPIGLIVLFVVWWCWIGVAKMGINKLMATGVAIGFIIVFLAFAAFTFKINNDPHVEYDVLTSDNVAFNEFVDKYDIVSINGKIVRVTEK